MHLKISIDEKKILYGYLSDVNYGLLEKVVNAEIETYRDVLETATDKDVLITQAEIKGLRGLLAIKYTIGKELKVNVPPNIKENIVMRY
jgi:hypothetical protein